MQVWELNSKAHLTHKYFMFWVGFFFSILWINRERMTSGMTWRGLGGLRMGVFHVLVAGATKHHEDASPHGHTGSPCPLHLLCSPCSWLRVLVLSDHCRISPGSPLDAPRRLLLDVVVLVELCFCHLCFWCHIPKNHLPRPRSRN